MSDQGERSAFRLVVVAILSAALGAFIAMHLQNLQPEFGPQVGRYELIKGSSRSYLFDTATGAYYAQGSNITLEEWSPRSVFDG